jgi:hypothetical protein
MNASGNISRITIDLPKESHQKLKAMAAVLGKSIREIVIESIEKQLKSSHYPNKKTRTAIKNAEHGKGLREIKNIEAFFKKLACKC